MSKEPKAIALGYFDGVHLGHAALLQRVGVLAREQNVLPAVFTFDMHPASRILGQQVPQLSSQTDKAALMRHCYGIREIIVGKFDDMMHMPWQDFVTEYLQHELGVVHVVVGHDFHFGYRGDGNPEKLFTLCREIGMGCDVIPRVELDGITVSSTYIRTLVAQGEMERAVAFLGHPHTFSGVVVHGKQLGRAAGFPTANLLLPDGMISPAHGVYASKVLTPDGQEHMAVTNVGVRPTIEDGNTLTVESWILDYSGDLYGREICVAYYTRLREERKFDSIAELTSAVYRNADETRRYFAKRNQA